MRQGLGWNVRAMVIGALAAGLLVPLACGGNVVFVPQGAGGSTSATGTGGVGGLMSSTAVSTPNDAVGTIGTTSGSFSTGDGAPCSTCADVLSGGNIDNDPGNLCGASQSAYASLVNCACATGCPASCGANACAIGGMPSNDCLMCLQSTCAAPFQACQSN